VEGSRQFKEFDDYLVPPERFATLRAACELPLAVATNCDQAKDKHLLLTTILADTTAPHSSFLGKRRAI